MPNRTRHVRQKSDDFKLGFEHRSNAFELCDGSSDLLLNQPSLSFRQPKFSCPTRVRVFGKKLEQCAWLIPIFLTRTISSIVLLSLAFVIPVVLGVVTVVLFPTVIDMSLESFQIPNQIASKHEDAFVVGKKLSHEWKPRLRRSAGPWPESPTGSGTTASTGDKYTLYKSRWTIDLVYLARGGQDNNMFTKERLHAIHKVEQSIMSYKGIQDFCWKWKMAKLDPILVHRYNACTPPISLVDFFFPSNGFYDGQGKDSKLTEDSINRTLTFLLSKQFTYWFVDGNFSVESRKSSFLRAQIKFGFPLKGYSIHDRHGKKFDEQHDKFKGFMKEFILFLKSASTDKVSILYGGPEVYDYLVETTLWHDVQLAKYTLILIVIFVFFLTSCSLYLTFFGILSILLSLPLAYFFFRVVFGVSSVGILSGASLFIIIGIGVDDVFVFINTFLHAKNAKDITSRMKHTLSTAGGATFFTSFTTAAAFGANCLSKIPAIHDFGLFMMLIVISCWFTVILMIPPALFLWDRHISKVEAKIFSFMLGWIPSGCCCNTRGSELPSEIEQFLTGAGQSSDRTSLPRDSQENTECITVTDAVTGTPIEDSSLQASPQDSLDDVNSDDSDLLCLSDDLNESSDTSPLLATSDSTTSSPPALVSRSSNCAAKLQFGLFYYAKPVYACRYALLAIYLIVLGGASYLDTRLTPSSKPPAFFKEGSNLQQLLDLKYNMSGDNYDCKICDNIIEDASNFINGRPTTEPFKSNTLPQGGSATKNPNAPPDVKTSDVATATAENPTSAEATKPATKGTKPTSELTQGTRPATSRRPGGQHSTTQKVKSSTLERTTETIPTTRSTTTRSTARFDGNGVTDIVHVNPTSSGDNGLVDPCDISPCTPVEKPILDSMATVNVVFGIKGIDRSKVSRDHVIASKGDVIMDPKFTGLVRDHRSVFVRHMCRLCNAFATNTDLVREGGADCFPRWFMDILVIHYSMYHECRLIKQHNTLNGKSKAHMYWRRMGSPFYRNFTLSYWLVMSFETTINKGSSSRVMHKEYNKWTDFVKKQVEGIDELQSAFHTSDVWIHMFMEIIAVNGAIYGIVFSLVLCIVAVVIFTGHVLLSIIVMLTILGVLCTVVCIFYLVGWHLGAVEAISLAILVGTSVDYCVHLVDGYIIAGRSLPNTCLSNKDLRGWRTSAAISHIGSSILSSAVTTIVASIPLCLTTIQLFAKFGQILAINTAVSIIYTLTFCMALLTIMAPARFRRSIVSRLYAVLGVLVFVGIATLCLYIVSLKGIPIQGPDGNPLFNV